MRRVRPAAKRLVLGARLDGRVMAEWVPAVWDVLATIERRDWGGLRRLLDPDVHWTTAIEEQLHGPSAMIASLSGDPPLGPPAYHESRDRRVVRWIDKCG